MRHELITFGIASQRFGIDIMTVREIRAWSPVTRLPRVPEYVAGVVNLRGAVLPRGSAGRRPMRPRATRSSSSSTKARCAG
jgi:CheW-like domain